MSPTVEVKKKKQRCQVLKLWLVRTRLHSELQANLAYRVEMCLKKKKKKKKMMIKREIRLCL